MKKSLSFGLAIPVAIAALLFAVDAAGGAGEQERPMKVADVQVVPKTPNIGIIPATME